MRALLAAVALSALAAGCGSSTSPSERGAPSPGSLEALWKQSGQNVALIPGTNDYSPGDLRISFLVVDNRGRLIAPPRARFWIARSLVSKPFQETVARLERVGVAGVSKAEDAPSVYVAHVRVSAPGTYYVLARPVGHVAIGGIRKVLVRKRAASPTVGSPAYPSATPTLASAHGRVAKITTRVPPDRSLLRYSIAESLRAHVPFVVTFATPRYCSSRTCGPVVDVVDQTRRRFANNAAIRFIHVEIYQDNDPRKGENRWVREWQLPSEPWTFLVGRDGRIKAKFEGPVSSRELESAVRHLLQH
ncbi:MAG: TlpA family protein disulfide reductase [Gaiellaceae bacterium]